MSDLKFELLVLGNEPGALWLLDRLTRSWPQARLAWMECGWSRRDRVALDHQTAREFAIPTQDCWSIEMVTPERLFPWSLQWLGTQYPTLTTLKKNRDPKRFVGLLRDHPELLTYAQGVWKRLGRAQNLAPKNYLSSVFLDRFSWWDPQTLVPSSVFRLSAPDPAQIDRITFLERGEFEVKLSGITIDTKHIVLAMSGLELERLVGRHPDLLNLVDAPCAPVQEGLIPITLRIQPDYVPSVLQPITLLFETDIIPEVHSQLLPLDCAFGEKTTDLTLWLFTEFPMNPDLLSQRLEAALDIIEKRIPFLRRGLIEQHPLFSESPERLNRYFIPKYDCTRLMGHRTRHHRFSFFPPDHRCHLPYPQGSLHAAHSLWTELVGSRIVRTVCAETHTHPTALA